MNKAVPFSRVLWFALVLFGFAGCTRIVRTVGDRMADRITTTILNQDDPATVRDGAPAYLLLIESMIDDQAPDQATLLAAAKLYSAYAGVFVEDPERATRLSAKAKRFGRRAICLQLRGFCQQLDGPSIGRFILMTGNR